MPSRSALSIKIQWPGEERNVRDRDFETPYLWVGQLCDNDLVQRPDSDRGNPTQKSSRIRPEVDLEAASDFETCSFLGRIVIDKGE